MTTDQLTGALTQAELMPKLREEIQSASRAHTQLSLMIIDLDHFKSVNDGFGHIRGDQVLADLCGRIRDKLRGNELLFRYGGDEFVLLMPDTPQDKAGTVAQELVDLVGRTAFAGDPPISLTVSIGLASFPDDAATAPELFAEADLRLYEAKRAGRNRAVGNKPAVRIELDFESKGRLIEREEVCRSLAGFLKRLNTGTRGVLKVTGPRGSGKTRLLAEVGEKAGMQDFRIIELDCTAATRLRPFFVLGQALNKYTGQLQTDPQYLNAQLQRLLDEKPRMLFTIDDVKHLDFETLSVSGNS